METTEHGVCISPLSSEVLKADESFFPSPGLFYYFCDGLQPDCTHQQSNQLNPDGRRRLLKYTDALVINVIRAK